MTNINEKYGFQTDIANMSDEAIFELATKSYTTQGAKYGDILRLTRESFNLLKYLADKKQLPKAQFEIGFIYINHNPIVEVDTALSLEYLNRASQNGDMHAAYYLSSLYMDTNDFGLVRTNQRKAETYLRHSANLGYDEAQYQLGILIENKKGNREENALRALPWFSKAADQDHELAQMSTLALKRQHFYRTFQEATKGNKRAKASIAEFFGRDLSVIALAFEMTGVVPDETTAARIVGNFVKDYPQKKPL